jgi:hypothetical protein
MMIALVPFASAMASGAEPSDVAPGRTYHYDAAPVVRVGDRCVDVRTRDLRPRSSVVAEDGTWAAVVFETRGEDDAGESVRLMETQIIDLETGNIRRVNVEVPELWGVTLVSLNDDRWLGYDLRTAPDPSTVSWTGRIRDVATLETIELSGDDNWLPMFLHENGSPTDLVFLEPLGPDPWSSPVDIHVLDATGINWTTIERRRHGLRMRGAMPVVVGDHILISGDKTDEDGIARYPDGEMITVVQVWSRKARSKEPELICEVETGNPHLIDVAVLDAGRMVTDTRSQGWSVVGIDDCQPSMQLPETEHGQRLSVFPDNGYIAGSNRLVWLDPRTNVLRTCDATDGSSVAHIQVGDQEDLMNDSQRCWICEAGNRWAVIVVDHEDGRFELTAYDLDDLAKSEPLILPGRAIRRVGTNAVAVVRENELVVRQLAMEWPSIAPRNGSGVQDDEKGGLK